MPWPKGQPFSDEHRKRIGDGQRRPLEERFWSKVERRRKNQCWHWTGALDQQGYGRIGVNDKPVQAHRVAWELAHGRSVPKGQDVDHVCHNRSRCKGGPTCLHRRCVNPAHLRATNRRTNLLAGRGLAAQYAARTHCKHGHLLDEANSYHRPGKPNARECRTCRAQVEARRRAKKRSP